MFPLEPWNWDHSYPDSCDFIPVVAVKRDTNTYMTRELDNLILQVLFFRFQMTNFVARM